MKAKEFDFIEGGVVVMSDPMFPLYIIVGSNPVLIDAGVAHLANIFLKKIEQTLGDQPLRKIVLTHTHWDHTGALSVIAEKHMASVFASSLGVDLLKKPHVIAFINRMNVDFANLQKTPTPSSLRTPKELLPANEGDIIELDESRHLHVISTPGHTRCSQSYLLEPGGILFPGDAAGVMERNGEIRPLFLSNYSDYINSLKKLSALSPSCLAFPHNRVIKGTRKVKMYFERSLTVAEMAFEQIKKEISTGKDENKIADELLVDTYSNSTLNGPREAFVINLLAMVRAVQKVL